MPRRAGSLSRRQSDLWKINRKKGGRDTFSAALLFVEHMVATSAPGPNGQCGSCQVKEAVKIPVIGNGDLLTAEDVIAMEEQTGCDGFMIARGAQGNPWIFRQILHYFETGEHLPKPPASEVAQMILRHARMMLEFKGEYIGIREIRKHAAWYTAGYPHGARLRVAINQVENYEQLETLLMEYFV